MSSPHHVFLYFLIVFLSNTAKKLLFRDVPKMVIFQQLLTIYFKFCLKRSKNTLNEVFFDLNA